MIDLRLVLIRLPFAACEHFGVPLLPLRAGSRVVLFSFGNQLVDRLKYKKSKEIERTSTGSFKSKGLRNFQTDEKGITPQSNKQ